MSLRLPTSIAVCVALVQVTDAGAATCMVANASLAFGTYNPVSGSPTTANGSIVVQCQAILTGNPNVPYTLLLSSGSSGSVMNRIMTGGSTNLPYNVFTSGSYTTVWDNTTGVTGNVVLSGVLGLGVLATGTDTQTAHGRILASRPVAVGSYADSLTITVSF